MSACVKGASLTAALALLSSCATTPAGNASDAIVVDTASMPLLAEVDPRFQSYNVEMVEVTGGRFWAPFDDPSGEMYQYREPMDLSDQRLLNLAANLSPAYVRVSGTWANNTYVPLEGESLGEAPEGFNQVLERDQWRGVVAFSKALDAPIVTSFAAGPGTRDAAGRWTHQQAQRLLELTTENGGTLHAAEFINEPSLVNQGGLPSGYDSTAFAQDFASFRDWARANAPDMLILGPGNLSEVTLDPYAARQLLAPDGAMSSERLMAATGEQVDIVSWHFYGGSSSRCGGARGVDARDAALTGEWLDRTLTAYGQIAGLRDEHTPGKPLWLSETAQAACGGSPWAASFADTFRYLNQNGVLAQRDVEVVMHNTLAASDYGLLDEDTLEPRPNYWGAVLWQRLMGPRVLSVETRQGEDLRVFAHCLPDMSGGVGVLAINPGNEVLELSLDGAGEAWLMQADDPYAHSIRINGRQPVTGVDGSISGLDGKAHQGTVQVPAFSIAFATVPDAANGACMG